MRTALRMLLEGRSQEAERTLRRRFLAWERARVPNRVVHPEPRCVSEIAARASFHRGVREQREREACKAAEARRKAERSRYLTSLLEDEDSAWSAIDSKLQRGSGSSYDQAFRALPGACRSLCRNQTRGDISTSACMTDGRARKTRCLGYPVDESWIYVGAKTVSDGSSHRPRCRPSEARDLASCEASHGVHRSLATITTRRRYF